MSGFPKLVPAFTAQLLINGPIPVGSTRNTDLVHVGIVPESGSFKSAEGYPIQLDAVVVHGADYIRADRDGRHVRLEVTALLRDAKSGGHVRVDYTGTVPTSGNAGLILAGSPDATTTEFGEVFTQVKFESDHPDLRAISEKVYVGSGRFILEPGKAPVVEYKISEVTA